ncbi:hypothetical protein CPB86DRAFT_701076, partial [Serendipita vermifera]
CGRIGHIARFCPAQGTAGGSFGKRPSASTSPVKCYRCGGLNHMARDCMAPAGTTVEGQQIVPATTNGTGTTTTTTKAKRCFKCRQEGHVCQHIINPYISLTTLSICRSLAIAPKWLASIKQSQRINCSHNG